MNGYFRQDQGTLPDTNNVTRQELFRHTNCNQYYIDLQAMNLGRTDFVGDLNQWLDFRDGGKYLRPVTRHCKLWHVGLGRVATGAELLAAHGHGFRGIQSVGLSKSQPPSWSHLSVLPEAQLVVSIVNVLGCGS